MHQAINSKYSPKGVLRLDTLFLRNAGGREDAARFREDKDGSRKVMRIQNIFEEGDEGQGNAGSGSNYLYNSTSSEASPWVIKRTRCVLGKERDSEGRSPNKGNRLVPSIPLEPPIVPFSHLY